MIGTREQAYFHLKSVRDVLEVFLADFAAKENGPFSERESTRLEVIHDLMNKSVQILREPKEEEKE